MPQVFLISCLAVVFNLVGRFFSVGAAALLAGRLPDHYNRFSFACLLTWGGLRGGLCIALAMSTAGMTDSRTYNVILGGTYAIVFFTTVFQGITMKRVYRRIERKVNENNA